MKLPTTPLGWSLSAAGAVVALLLVIFVLGRFGISWDPFGWAAARHEQDRVGNIVGKAGTGASDAATAKTSEQAASDAANATLTQENRDAILSAPDASATAGASGAAGAAGLCKRCSIRRDARYAELCRPYPAPPAC